MGDANLLFLCPPLTLSEPEQAFAAKHLARAFERFEIGDLEKRDPSKDLIRDVDALLANMANIAGVEQSRPLDTAGTPTACENVVHDSELGDFILTDVVLELRTYDYIPAQFSKFVNLTKSESFLPRLRASRPLFYGVAELGGNPCSVTHLWHYPDLSARTAVRESLARDSGFQSYLEQVAPTWLKQETVVGRGSFCVVGPEKPMRGFVDVLKVQVLHEDENALGSELQTRLGEELMPGRTPCGWLRPVFYSRNSWHGVYSVFVHSGENLPEVCLPEIFSSLVTVVECHRLRLMTPAQENHGILRNIGEPVRYS